MTRNKNHTFHDDTKRYENWFAKNLHLFNSEVQAIKELMESDKRNLEIGVGTGIFAEHLQIPEGVEPSMSMRRIAKKRGIQVYEGTAESLPLLDQTYDQVFMITADCFLQDLLTAIKEIHRILVDNGIFLIAFLDRETPLGAIYEEKKANDPFYKNAHFHSANEMRTLLTESGFQIEEERQTIFSFDNVPQPPKIGLGEGVFAVIKSRKRIR